MMTLDLRIAASNVRNAYKVLQMAKGYNSPNLKYYEKMYQRHLENFEKLKKENEK